MILPVAMLAMRTKFDTVNVCFYDDDAGSEFALRSATRGYAGYAHGNGAGNVCFCDDDAVYAIADICYETQRDNGAEILERVDCVIADICLRDLSIPASMLAVRTAMTQETFVSMTTMPALIVHRGVLPAAMPAMHTAMTQKRCFCDDDAGSDFGVLPAAMPTIRTAITQETLFL
jgi:prepilin-type processing-associated H-X9-DG protein